jgi:hypothetical protein
MSGMAYPEFIGISQATSRLIESRRLSPDETKDDIINRELSLPTKATPPSKRKSAPVSAGTLDLGQGAKLAVGETMYLFLSKTARRANRPDATALVGSTGIMMNGTVYPARRGFFNKAMADVQVAKGDVDSNGKPTSLSAWRQWHVLRDDRLTSLLELKDPTLANVRMRNFIANQNADELGL